MASFKNRIIGFMPLLLLLAPFFVFSCSTMNLVEPEVNLMRLDVQDVTLSHVNLLADLRVYNPNVTALTIQGVDYTLHLEGIRVFSGRNTLSQTIAPQEYGHVTLRLASAYWDIIQLLNRLPDKSEVTFFMEGSILIGGSRLFAHRFSFAREGTIPLQQ